MIKNNIKKNNIKRKKVNDNLIRIIISVLLSALYVFYIYKRLDDEYFYLVKDLGLEKPFFKWLALNSSSDIAVFTSLFILAIVIILKMSKFRSIIFILLSYTIFVLWDYSNHNILFNDARGAEWLSSIKDSRDLIALFFLCTAVAVYIIRGRKWWN